MVINWNAEKLSKIAQEIGAAVIRGPERRRRMPRAVMDVRMIASVLWAHRTALDRLRRKLYSCSTFAQLPSE